MAGHGKRALALIFAALLVASPAFAQSVSNKSTSVFRDYNTPGNALSGVYNPPKADVRNLFDTINDRLGASLADYGGVDVDGGADMGALINTATASIKANVGCGVLRLPATGLHAGLLITTPIVPRSCITIEGKGRGETVLLVNNNYGVAQAAGTQFYNGAITGVTFRANTGFASSSPLYFTSIQNSRITNIGFEGFRSGVLFTIAAAAVTTYDAPAGLFQTPNSIFNFFEDWVSDGSAVAIREAGAYGGGAAGSSPAGSSPGPSIVATRNFFGSMSFWNVTGSALHLYKAADSDTFQNITTYLTATNAIAVEFGDATYAGNNYVNSDRIQISVSAGQASYGGPVPTNVYLFVARSWTFGHIIDLETDINQTITTIGGTYPAATEFIGQGTGGFFGYSRSGKSTDYLLNDANGFYTSTIREGASDFYRVGSGSATQPAFAASQDRKTGLYFDPTSHALSIASNGTAAASFTAAGISAPALTLSDGTRTVTPTTCSTAQFVNGVSSSGIPTCATPTTGSSTAAAGSSGQFQTNSGGSLAGVTISGAVSIDGTTGVSTLAAGQAIANLGYTPVNKAGDTMSGKLNINGIEPALSIVPTTDFLQLYAYGGANTNSAKILSSASQPALSTASRTSGGAPGTVSAGVLFFGFNDDTSANKRGNWGAYGENRRYANAGSSVGIELNITDFGSPYSTDPYAAAYAAGNMSAGLYLQSGGGCAAGIDGACYNPVSTAHDLLAQTASVALAIGNNGAQFYHGLQFNYNALFGNDGHTDGQYASAIIMPRNDGIEWDYCSNTTAFPANCATSQVGAKIYSSVKTAGAEQRLIFDDALGTILANSASKVLFQVAQGAARVNGLQVLAGAAGTGLALNAQGDDTNIDLALTPKGTGTIVLSGVPTSGTAVGTVCVASGNRIYIKTTTGACL